jgi:hypothetical protein
VNFGSRSLTIELGTPWSLTMWSKKTPVTVVAVYGCPGGRKWAALENLSTTVSMTDQPLTLGSPSMKSIVMSAHTVDDTGRGWSSSTDCSYSVLLR